jgi:hypothetical protein
MDALDFLDDDYGTCAVPAGSIQWTYSLLIIAALAILLIKKTEWDLEKTRRHYLGLDDVD